MRSMAKRGKINATTPPIYGEVAERSYDHAKHDLSPWSETPASTRVARYRYDYINRAVQVQWRNNKNHGYIYFDVPYEAYRSFARLASKGKGVNSHLNGFEYRQMTPDEVGAPSNAFRRQVARSRG
jgi:KTSC domain